MAPNARVHPVEPEGFDDIAQSLVSGNRERVDVSRTSIADALLPPTPGALTWPILKDLAGEGLAVSEEQIRKAVRFGFHELNLHRIQLTVFSYNERAVALYEKLGFTREGVYREHLQRDGQRHDMYLYGLLRREWEEERDAREKE